MKLTSHKILKLIVKNREVSHGDLLSLIPTQFNDYRDYYPISILCNAGYIKSEWSNGDGSPIIDEKMLSSILYAKATGASVVNDYHNSTNRSIDVSSKFYATAKSDLYFSELRAKRIDRVITLAIGIIVGITSATLALLIKSV